MSSNYSSSTIWLRLFSFLGCVLVVSSLRMSSRKPVLADVTVIYVAVLRAVVDFDSNALTNCKIKVYFSV